MNDIKSYTSVQKWTANVNRYYNLSDAEWVGRLQILADFCKSEDKDPDTMIAEALVEKSDKVDYMRHLKKFVKEQSVNPRIAQDLENVVLSFFIHTGARVVVRPYSD